MLQYQPSCGGGGAEGGIGAAGGAGGEGGAVGGTGGDGGGPGGLGGEGGAGGKGGGDGGGGLGALLGGYGGCDGGMGHLHALKPLAALPTTLQYSVVSCTSGSVSIVSVRRRADEVSMTAHPLKSSVLHACTAASRVRAPSQM
jgi:hypothetical protein